MDRTAQIAPDAILLVTTVRNERVRLPYFMDYYRKMGVGHFLVIDNGSDDGTVEYLRDQPDLSLFQTNASYARARYGIDWMNDISRRYGTGHWIITVDADELLVYPHCDTRPLRALTDWLDALELRSFSAMLLDTYPEGPIAAATYREGQNPLEVAPWFDSGNYAISRNPRLKNLWIQGGVRARAFFSDNPIGAPALNKIPLVKWASHMVYVSSTHMLLPRGLNLVYDSWGGEKASGVLIHTKFVGTLVARATEEAGRAEHYRGGAEYRAYTETLDDDTRLWSDQSVRYINWRQLEVLGLMSKGNWA
nr:glycosyltransferase family 2 protein [Ketogulonicigenium vulgare]